MTVRIPVHSFDTLVIGGGLAGIAAAQRLGAAGRSVAVLEARPRLGGRLWTRHDPSVGYPIELGPEWFDSYGTVHRLLAGRHAAMPAARGGRMSRGDAGAFEPIDDTDEGNSPIEQRLAKLKGGDRSLEVALQQCCADPESADEVAMLRSYVEGFHAADPAALSLRWLQTAEANQPAGVAQLRAAGGLDQALDAFLAELGRDCTVYLDAVVRQVRWRRGRVLADVRHGSRRATFDARAAVVTLPLPVLQQQGRPADRVAFIPSLAAKRTALSRLSMGPVIKLVHCFDRAFWQDDDRLRDALFLHDFTQPIPTWWTTRPVDAPVLTAWAAGPQVARVGAVSRDELRRRSLASLAQMLRRPLADVTRHWQTWYWHDWQRDPFALGAYSWVRVGGLHAHAALARPLDATLYFAGEATCGSGVNATMDGAIQSGWRAAGELLSRR